eukprot:GHVU01142643.1.p1 GENE.GHVU01142643.1~~GHVU01142643.1.p1  ORF type:complete len:137 (+),score=11.73 GHVU01142643.1:488-898(+)
MKALVAVAFTALLVLCVPAKATYTQPTGIPTPYEANQCAKLTGGQARDQATELRATFEFNALLQEYMRTSGVSDSSDINNCNPHKGKKNALLMINKLSRTAYYHVWSHNVEATPGDAVCNPKKTLPKSTPPIPDQY